MAGTLFNKGREGILKATIDYDTDDIRVMLVLSTYTLDQTDEFLADLGAVDNGRTTALLSKTTTSGVADAADISLTATAASACNALVIFKHTGSDATAALIAYMNDYTGLPFTPSAGGTVNIVFDSGTNKIFKL